MSITNTQIEKVLEFIRGKMDKQEQEDFEQQLLKNPQLQQEVSFQKSILNAQQLNEVEEKIQQARIDNLIENKEEHPNYKEIQANLKQAREANLKKRNYKKVWAMTIVSGCLFALAWIGVKQFHNSSADQLQMSFAKINESLNFTDMLAVRSEYRNVSARMNKVSLQIEAIQALSNAGKYDLALNKLEELAEEPSLNPNEVIYFKSVLLFNNQEYNKSIMLLESLNALEDPQYCHVHYFLMLNYLANNAPEKARTKHQWLLKHSEFCDSIILEDLKNYF